MTILSKIVTGGQSGTDRAAHAVQRSWFMSRKEWSQDRRAGQGYLGLARARKY